MSTTSSHQSSVEDARIETKKFILLKDVHAKSSKGKFFDKQRVLKGSLWEEKDIPSPNHSLSSFGSSGSKGTVLSGSGKTGISLPLSHNARKLELYSIEYDEVRVLVSEGNISELTEEQCRLLLAIPDCDERYKVYMDRDHMNTSCLINVNSRVIVSTRKLEACKGIVRWKGRIANKQGVCFGVEIQDPSKKGCGDTDGAFNAVRLFSCELNDGVFVNISNVKLIPPERPERKEKRISRERSVPDPVIVNGKKSERTDVCDSVEVSRTPDISSIEEEEEELTKNSNLYPVVDPRIGDRVVWFGESGYERATIKWIGTLPDENGESLLGVEFDNPVGKGTGFYQKKRLFHARKGHASLVPLVGLYQEHERPSPCRSPPPPQFGNLPHPSFSSPTHPVITANSILKDLDIATEPELKTGAICDNDEDFKKSAKKADKVSGHYTPSARRRQNGGSNVKKKLTENLRAEESVSSSNDSLEHVKGLVSPRMAHRFSPQKKSPKQSASLLVPATNHRPSSVGSISPRSCDASSQGSDTHSPQSNMTNTSPSHLPRTPQHHDSVSDGPHNSTTNHSPTYSIKHTSPSRRKRHDPVSNTSVKEGSQLVTISAVCRTTPISSHIIEECLVTVDGQPGIVKWIGYELTKPGRYFAGVKMEEPNGSCSCGWYGNERLVDSSRKDIMFVNLRKCEAVHGSGSKSSEIIEGLIPPPPQCLQHVGEWKGIQGDSNSCYMDACIFSMFAFSVVFDELLRIPKKCNDISGYSEIQRTLRCHIVNPLRKNGIVMQHAIHQLRKLLDQLGLVEGLRCEEKDPEEFINLLLINVFRMPPPIHLSNGQTCHSFHLMSEKDARIAFPTVQELLENSCAQAQLKFKQTPSYLILHMPRSSKDYRMYDKILPSINLDLTDITEGAPRRCYVCGEEAIWECPECYATENEWKRSTFCHECSNTVHKHEKRSGHMPIDMKIFEESNEGDSKTVKSTTSLCLFAVLCIETSHYVAYTRAAAVPTHTSPQWLMLDSMAKRLGDEYVPKVVEVEDLGFWLSAEGFASIAKDFDKVPPKVKRLVKDGYICFYCKQDALASFS